MTEPPAKPKKVRRRNDVDPLDEFVAFNFAQATARIIDNIGFTSTKPFVLEILSRLMLRYFEDLCKRIVYSKEDAKRFDVTLDDVDNAYKDLQISIDEFQDYMQQVRQIKPIPKMPLIPFQGPNKTDLTLKSPKKQLAPITDETVYPSANREEYLQESISEFQEFLSQMRNSTLVPEHPLVSLRKITPRSETPTKKATRLKIRIGDELTVDREIDTGSETSIEEDE